MASREAHARWPVPAAGLSESGDPEVIFTFDDGPHHKWGAQILDTLKAHGISAIFYWVGHRVDSRCKRGRRRHALVDRAVREGHLIGNHTVNHVHLCQGPVAVAAMEIDHNREVFERLTGLPVLLFRTPYGDRCRRLTALLHERGLTHLHWDIDPHEYDGLSSKDTAAYVIGRIKRLRGRAVILMHDTKAQTARALPMILDWIVVENRRRVARGERPIRVMSGADLLLEQARGPLWEWGQGTAEVAQGTLLRALGTLVPGAPAPAALSRAEPVRRPAW